MYVYNKDGPDGAVIFWAKIVWGLLYVPNR